MRKAVQRSNRLPVSLEEPSCGAGMVGASLQTPLYFRNCCRANGDAEDQLLVGVCLQTISLLYVCPFANATVLPTPWLLYYLCWLCTVFEGAEEG